MTNWKKATSGEQYPIWNEEKKVGQTLEGVLTEKREDVGPNHTRLYVVEQKGGEKVSVWGNKVLDDTLPNYPIGTIIRLTYLGKEKSEKGTQYHNYEIEYDEDSMSDVGGADIPFDVEEETEL